MAFAIPRFPFWSTKTSEEAIGTNENEGKLAAQEGDSEDATAQVEDIDAPPAFPMLDSAQRSKIPQRGMNNTALPAPPSLTEIDFDVVPPSPTSSSSSRTLSPPQRQTKLSQSSALTPNSVSAAPSSSLQTPTTTTKKPNPAVKKRAKVALAPGCSPLDWARVKSSGDPKLRAGHMMPIRVSLDELKKHNTTGDAWSAFNGKVYNITEYLRFHPGGEKELMRCAGRDGTKLFMLTHAWVNVDYMLDTCMIGFLVPS